MLRKRGRAAFGIIALRRARIDSLSLFRSMYTVYGWIIIITPCLNVSLAIIGSVRGERITRAADRPRRSRDLAIRVRKRARIATCNEFITEASLHSARTCLPGLTPVPYPLPAPPLSGRSYFPGHSFARCTL